MNMKSCLFYYNDYVLLIDSCSWS